MHTISFEDHYPNAKQSESDIELLFSSSPNLEDHFHKIVPTAIITKQEEHEAFIGTKIPNEVKNIRQMISSRKGDANE